MVGNAPVHKEEMKEQEHWSSGRLVQPKHFKILNLNKVSGQQW